MTAGAPVAVADLGVVLHDPVAGDRVLVEPLDFRVEPGRCLAVIGESGSGKTLTARAVGGVLPTSMRATGTVAFGDDVIAAGAGEAVWRERRGRDVVLLLQDPFSSLSPVHRCGAQIALGLPAAIRSGGRRAVRDAVAARLAEVNLPASVADRYPHELSGGMRQRVAIAAALATEPALLIADEPTTALDAATQGEILDLLRSLQERHRMALILISHDLGLVRGRADDVLVLRGGAVVERGTAARVLDAPEHDYTRMLLEASPRLVTDRAVGASPSGTPVLEAVGLRRTFGTQVALHDVSIAIGQGEVVAVVGESGSGKSTLARCIAGLDEPDAGTVAILGASPPRAGAGRPADLVQVVFQDPYSTLNPALRIDRTLRQAIAAGQRDGTTVADLLRQVDLDPALARRRPAQLSGGQRQRVAIARAIATRPKLLICDESVSALDVSVQAQVLALLAELRTRLGMAMLFISHDLAVVSEVADRIVVMRHGQVVESGSRDTVLTAPQHPYTRMLLAAAERESLR